MSFGAVCYSYEWSVLRLFVAAVSFKGCCCVSLLLFVKVRCLLLAFVVVVCCRRRLLLFMLVCGRCALLLVCWVLLLRFV